MSNEPGVCIIGMGYVGLTLAIALGDAGCRVIGVENNPHTLARLKEGNPEVYEPNLAEHYRKLLDEGRIVISDRPAADMDANAFIITVGTPLDENGHANMEPIQVVASEIAAILQPGDLVALRSTVKVGTTRDIVKPILDAAGVPYYLAMCPERTIGGKALEELHSLPQLVGGIDEVSVEKACALFRRLGVETLKLSSAEAAEFAKLLCNMHRDVNYAFANEVALAAEELGLDSREAIWAANHDYPRCNIPAPGLVGGPCLEKDTHILAESLADFKPKIALAARQLHKDIVPWAVAKMAVEAKKAGMPVRKVAIMGLAFKGRPETGDVRGSLAIDLKKRVNLEFPQAAVVGYDPVASQGECQKWGLTNFHDLEKALDNADLVFIQTNHKNFADPAFAGMLARHCQGKIIYDFWGVLGDALSGQTQARVLKLGDGGKRGAI